MNTPLISVIIPTYNCAHYLGEAVASVLSQAYSAIEVLVVDDGSTDATAQVAAEFGGRIRYFRQANGGIGAARNSGLAHARGDFIAYLDADDLYVPGRLARQMDCLARDPGLDCVQGLMLQFISPELGEDFAATVRVDTQRALAAPMAGTTLIRRDALDRVGPWSTTLTVGTDLDWCARMQEAGIGSLMLQEVLLRRRIHRSNTNLVHAGRRNERLHVLKAMLDRRRGAGRSGSDDSNHSQPGESRLHE